VVIKPGKILRRRTGCHFCTGRVRAGIPQVANICKISVVNEGCPTSDFQTAPGAGIESYAELLRNAVIQQPGDVSRRNLQPGSLPLYDVVPETLPELT
jgi:hypothetical protein